MPLLHGIAAMPEEQEPPPVMMTLKRLETIRKGIAARHPDGQELIAEVKRCWGELEAAKILLLDIADERNTANERLEKLRADITHAIGVSRKPEATLIVINHMVKQAGN